MFETFPVGIYLFKVNNGSSGTMCNFYSELTKIHQNDVNNFAPVVIVDFETLAFTLLTLKR